MKNLKIGTQLMLGFATVLFFVILLGAISYLQSDEIHLQTETIYNHPLMTRRALEEIRSSILLMRINIRDYLLAEDAKAYQSILNDMAVNQTDVPLEIGKLRQCYLGPQSDIDEMFREFTKWVSVCETTIRLVDSGKLKEARDRHLPGGIAPTQALKVLGALKKISDFAKKKGDELYNNSVALNKSLKRQLILLVAAILLSLIHI